MTATAVLCAACVPAMYGGPIDYGGRDNAGGRSPAIIANFPPPHLVLGGQRAHGPEA